MDTDFSSLRSHYLPITLHGGFFFWDSPIHSGMPTSIIVHIFFRKQYCWDFMGASSLSCVEDIILQMPWSFCSYTICLLSSEMFSGVRIVYGRYVSWNLALTVTCSLYFDQFQISVMVPISYKKKLPWRRVRATFICISSLVWNHKHLETWWSWCSSLGSKSSPVTANLLGIPYQAGMDSPYWAGLKYN